MNDYQHRQERFDEYAKNYRVIHTQNIIKFSGEDSDYFSKYKIELIKQTLDLTCHKWLDLGCGDGASSKYVQTFFDHVMYVGIDVSEESIHEAQNRNTKNCIFRVYDGKNIPYEDGTFDVVYMACVLHHIPPTEHQHLLSEIYRVLSDNGRLIIFEHNPINPLTRKLVNDCIFDDDAILISAPKLKKSIRSAGFTTISVRYSIFFPRKSIFNHLVKFEPKLSWCNLGGQYWIESMKG